jgi:hypothetical protein
METIIYIHSKRHYIIDVKNLLNENNIPISSIQLYIRVNMSKFSKQGVHHDVREQRNELIVPIEEFNEELNDAQNFEIWIDEKYVEKAEALIEEWSFLNFYKYCIFRSNDYEEADDYLRFLRKNNIPCDDIPFTNILEDNTEEFLIFIDPEYHHQIKELLNRE